MSMNWQDIFYSIEVPQERKTELRNRIKNRFKCETWTTQDNRIIPVNLLRKNHIANIWRVLYRSCIEAYKSDNNPLFERRYASVTMINAELKRRGETFQGMQFNELEEIFVDQNYDDYDDGFGTLDHYEAMHNWIGD